MMKITAERVRELLNYDPTSGLLTWKQRAAHRVQVGDVAGCPEKGYWRIRIDNKLHRAHRLAWLHYYGEWPKALIDHKDGNKRNNAIDNLRDVSKSINGQNTRNGSRKNSCGYLGVSRAMSGRYKSEIVTGAGRIHLGVFDSPELAHQAYVAAKRIYHAGCML